MKLLSVGLCSLWIIYSHRGFPPAGCKSHIHSSMAPTANVESKSVRNHCIRRFGVYRNFNLPLLVQRLTSLNCAFRYCLRANLTKNLKAIKPPAKLAL